MSDVEVIDHDDPGQEIAVRNQSALAVAPNVTADDLVQRLDVIKGAMQKAMQPNIDYGVIPGTGSKPTLLKPGAEKLAVLFQLDLQPENETIWHDDGHLTVISRCTVYHAPSGNRLGKGEGICTSREAKYAFRQGERVCPTCGQPAIIKGKAEYGGGWLCFKKKGGCGAKFADGDTAITSQDVGRVANDNIADTYNTVDKMASKRARIDAVLAVTGASALFTQDVEDMPRDDPEPTRTTVPAQDTPPPAQDAEPKLATKQQTQRIAIKRDKLYEAGLTEEQYRKAMKDRYGVDSATLLTFEQANDLIGSLSEAGKQMGVET